jgi:hypothetical protein
MERNQFADFADFADLNAGKSAEISGICGFLPAASAPPPLARSFRIQVRNPQFQQRFAALERALIWGEE